MPTVCKYVPNRTKPRYFTTCDVARIAEQCHLDTGAPSKIIIACVAKRLKYSDLKFLGGDSGASKPTSQLDGLIKELGSLAMAGFVAPAEGEVATVIAIAVQARRRVIALTVAAALLALAVLAKFVSGTLDQTVDDALKDFECCKSNKTGVKPGFQKGFDPNRKRLN